MSTKYTKEVLTEAVGASKSFAGVLRHLGLRQAGGTQHHIAKKINEYGVDTSHFKGQGWNKGMSHPNLRKSKDKILIELPEGSRREHRHMLLRAMLESGVHYKCRCGLIGEWEGRDLTLEINHKDGNWLNNLIDNLEFLCPNCHSQEEHSNRPHKYRPVSTPSTGT